MPKSIDVVTTLPCMVAGKPVKVGTRLTLNEGDGHNLLASKRGVLAKDAPEAPKSGQAKAGSKNG